MLKVLIVEDEDIIRKGLLYTINWLSMDCLVAGAACNGKEGLQMILELSPQLVITDIRMPEMDGLEMIEQAQKTRSFRSVLLTSYSDFDYAKRAIGLHVFDYLLKPVDFGRLGEAIESAKVERQRTAMFRQTLAKQDELRQVDLLAQLRDARVKNEAVRAMLEYVEGHYAEKITVCDLARLLCYSDTFLTRKFKEVVGINFNDYN